MSLTPIEWLGYASSLLVLISLSMKSVVKLRILNGIGSGLFALFAFVTESYPTFAMNAALVLIDGYYLYKMLHTVDAFEILEVQAGDALVQRLIQQNQLDIVRIFGPEALAQATHFAVYMRNNDLAGLVGWKPLEDGTAQIYIDFVVRSYRDTAVGRHFFVNDTSFWQKRNFGTLIMKDPSRYHAPYLARVGFVQQITTTTWTCTL